MIIIENPITTKFDNTPLFRNDEAVTKSNRILKWFPMDSEELFNNNLKKEPKNKSLLYYLDNPITYKLNEYGFRADSFETKKPGNVFLGCSHTFGIGHHLEDTWSYKVNKEVGGRFFNLGSPGTGIQTSLRLLQYWSTKLNIKNIFHYQPIYHRYEFYTDNSKQYNSIHHIIINELEYDGITDIDKCLVSEYNILQLYKVHILAIEAIAKSLGINYHIYSPYESDFKNLAGSNDIQARDLAHYEIQKHNLICEKFISPTGKQLI